MIKPIAVYPTENTHCGTAGCEEMAAKEISNGATCIAMCQDCFMEMVRQWNKDVSGRVQ